MDSGEKGILMTTVNNNILILMVNEILLLWTEMYFFIVRFLGVTEISMFCLLNLSCKVKPRLH